MQFLNLLGGVSEDATVGTPALSINTSNLALTSTAILPSVTTLATGGTIVDAIPSATVTMNLGPTAARSSRPALIAWLSVRLR